MPEENSREFRPPRRNLIESYVVAARRVGLVSQRTRDRWCSALLASRFSAENTDRRRSCRRRRRRRRRFPERTQFRPSKTHQRSIDSVLFARDFCDDE